MNIGTKRGDINEKSSMLWYKGLGHNLNERLERLVKDKILWKNLDFRFSVCVDGMKNPPCCGINV